MTTFNTVISVVSLFVLLVKTAMYTMHFWFPLLSVVVHAILVGLFATSLYNQTAGDYLDVNAVATRPWYLTHSCKTYASSGNLGFCYQARASVYVVAVMVYVSPLICRKFTATFPSDLRAEKATTKILT
jgi:hypothetical protein